MPDDDLEQLLARTAVGDREAFDQLYDRTAAKLHSVSLRMLANHSDAPPPQGSLRHLERLI